jgi:hypothetical protein
MLPASLVTALQEHLQRVKRLHQQDLERGYGAVSLPFALERKYSTANREWLGSSNRSPCYPPLQNRAC